MVVQRTWYSKIDTRTGRAASGLVSHRRALCGSCRPHVHEPVAHVFLLAGSLECFSLPPLRWFIYPTYLCAQAQHSPECFPLGPSARTELARWIITECMCMSCCSHLTLNARCAEAVLCISLQLVGAVTN